MDGLPLFKQFELLQMKYARSSATLCSLPTLHLGTRLPMPQKCRLLRRPAWRCSQFAWALRGRNRTGWRIFRGSLTENWKAAFCCPKCGQHPDPAICDGTSLTCRAVGLDQLAPHRMMENEWKFSTGRWGLRSGEARAHRMRALANSRLRVSTFAHVEQHIRRARLSHRRSPGGARRSAADGSQRPVGACGRTFAPSALSRLSAPRRSPIPELCSRLMPDGGAPCLERHRHCAWMDQWELRWPTSSCRPRTRCAAGLARNARLCGSGRGADISHLTPPCVPADVPAPVGCRYRGRRASSCDLSEGSAFTADRCQAGRAGFQRLVRPRTGSPGARSRRDPDQQVRAGLRVCEEGVWCD